MSAALKELISTVESGDVELARQQLADFAAQQARHPLLFKGMDIGRLVKQCLVREKPLEELESPIFSTIADRGEREGFLREFGVTSFDQLATSAQLPEGISINYQTVESVSELTPRERTFLTSSCLPAVRVIFIEATEQ